MSSLKPSDIQALVARGLTHRHSAHVFYRSGSVLGHRKLLRILLQEPFGVTSAEPWNKEERPEVVIQISLTCKALLEFGCTNSEFPDAFLNGPSREEMISKWLGDVGRNSPEFWWDEQPLFAREPHGCIHIYGNTPELRQMLISKLHKAFEACDTTEVFPWKAGPNSANGRIEADWLPGDLIHFGYLDGISQPQINWPWSPSPAPVDPFFFVLDQPKPKDWPFNTKPRGNPLTHLGSYLIIKIVEQNVPAFNRYLASEGAAFDGLSEASGKELLAAKLVGRWRDGSPLVLFPTAPSVAHREENQFDYSSDQKGKRCPFSSHIRVTNPRSEKAIEPAHQPGRVILRRGVPYGPQLSPPDSEVDDGIKRGLVGLFLCSDIEKQFEILSKWMHDASFRVEDSFDDQGLRRQDSFLGSTEFADRSRVVEIEEHKLDLPNVTTTKGTIYLFMPSLPGLAKIVE